MSAATAKWCAGRSSVRWCRSAMPPRWILRCVPRCARSGDATCSLTMPAPTPGTCVCRYWWRSSPPFINARRSGAPPMADLYTQAISRLLFPAQERCKGRDTLRVRRQLEETQWWPRERLVDLQLQRLRRLRDRLMRTELLPAFEMAAVRLDEFVVRIRALEPRMLFGYPSSLALIARHARERGIALDRLGIKVVFVTAERLYDAQRELIEQVFGCPVANGYGGRDAGFIAHQCPAGGMHITAEDIIVEIVDGEGRPLPPGEAGEVVVTHLATPDFPFIRYRTGDDAALDKNLCACGRGLTMQKEIHGRTTDFILAADGTVMHGLALIYVVRDVVGVENFKIIQDDRLHTRVQLVTGADFAEESVAAIRTGMQRRLGADVEVAVERVAVIPRENSGKHRYVVSHVAPSVGQEANA